MKMHANAFVASSFQLVVALVELISSVALCLLLSDALIAILLPPTASLLTVCPGDLSRSGYGDS